MLNFASPRKKPSFMLPLIETAPEADLRAYQSERLSELLAYLQERSPFYRRLFGAYGIDVRTVRTLDDLPRLPFTTKDDLQRYGDDFLCVDKREVVDFVTTSGTLGDPVTFALTDADLDRLAYNEALSMSCAGIGADDILLLTTTLDRRFMAGLAYFLGARRLGAGCVRVGSGLPELQWDTIRRIEPTVLVAVPSFILKMVEYAEKNGIDYRNSSLRSALCIGEPLRDVRGEYNTLGRKLRECWDIPLYSTYAGTEMSTAFTECACGRGGHAHPELIIVEVLDADDRPVREGEVGEVVVSTLGVQAMPLLRFRTGDLCSLHTEACPCGRSTPRLGAVVGRKQQMIKYKGTTLFPPAIYNLLEQFDDVRGFVVEVLRNALDTDEIRIHLACREPSPAFAKKLKDHFRAKLRVAPDIRFCSADEIQALRFPPLSRKPVLFIDRR